jgi:manganese/iron transport system ATP-binding protein
MSVGNASTAAALELDGVAVAYGTRLALEGVSGRLGAAEALALVGPNGAGKTTLLRAVLGLVRLAQGHIRVLGLHPEQARPYVAYVPQADTLDAQFPVAARQVVLMGRYRRIGWLRPPGRVDRAAASAALAAVGLADRADDRFGSLSGGQRQRVLLARALAAQPRLLLLDEPFNAVDMLSRDALLSALAAAKAAGTTIVLSTHDLSIAQLLCEQACILNRRQVGFGPIRETITSAALREAYGLGAVPDDDGASAVTGTDVFGVRSRLPSGR